MKLLAEANIGQAIISCRPERIAVAYVGADWRTYLPEPKSINSIILSPTFGTNPDAVSELVHELGWERVLFLDELHAKVFLGARSAVVGSANLTTNGLSGHGLIEFAVGIEGEPELKAISKRMDSWESLANQKYRTTNSKKNKLSKLKDVWSAAIANGVDTRRNKQKKFESFELLSERDFYVGWYGTPEDVEYSEDVKSVEGDIINQLHYANKDKLEKNKWILVWKVNDDSTPDTDVDPHWLFIHDIFEDGILNESTYRKCVVQLGSKRVPPEPFKLSKEVIHAFWSVVEKPGVSEYLIQGNDFDLKESFKGVPKLIKGMKSILRNK